MILLLFPGPFFLLFLRQFYVNRPRLVLVTAPRSTHAAAMLGFLRSSDRSHFFTAAASFTTPPPPASEEVLRCPFPDLYVRVRSHLRSFAAPVSLFPSLLIFHVAERLVYLAEKCRSFAEILLGLK